MLVRRSGVKMLDLIVFLLLLFSGLPVAFAILGGAVAYLVRHDLSALFDSIPIQLYAALEINGLLAIPLFMLVGEVMNRGGLTRRLIEAAEVLLGGFRGGLAYANLFANAVAAAILGSATAQISVMSRVMIPEMERRGYTREFSGALTVTAGLLGPIIPPSMVMIIYGILAVQPIAPLFIAGIVPGLLIVVGLALVIAFAALVQGTLPQGETTARSEAARILARGLFPLLIPLLVISGILAGATTPTEAGGVGAFFAIILGLAYRDLKLRDFPSILLEVALSTATVTALIGVAAVCSWVLAFDGVPDRMVEMMRTSTQSPEAFLLLVAAVLLVLGMFLEGISVMVVVVPLLVPVATTLGINPLHFGVVVTVATVIGLVTPPVGPGLYIVMAATGVPMGRLFKAAVPFLLAVVMVLTLICLYPPFTTWLPNWVAQHQ